MSSGQGGNGLRRETSDPEDGRGPPMALSPVTAANNYNNPAVGSGWFHQHSTGTAPPALAAAPARDNQHLHGNSFAGTSAWQDGRGADNMAPGPTAPQHNNTGVPPGTRAPGSKRRMSLGSKSGTNHLQQQEQQQQQRQQARASLFLSNTSFYTVAYSVRQGDSKTQQRQQSVDKMVNPDRSMSASTTSSIEWNGVAVSASANPQRKSGHGIDTDSNPAVGKLLDELERVDLDDAGRAEDGDAGKVVLWDFRMEPMGRTPESEVLFPAGCELLIVHGHYWDSVRKEWQKFKEEAFSIAGQQALAEKKVFRVTASASDFKTRTTAPAPEMKSVFQTEAEKKATQLAADEIKWEAEERLKREQDAPIRGLARKMSRMDIRRRPSNSGHNSRNPNSSDVPKLVSWLPGNSRRMSMSRIEAPSPAGGAGAAAVTAATPGFALPPMPPMVDNLGGTERGRGGRLAHNESISGSVSNLAGNPDTPPPLRSVYRRRSLLHREPTEEAPQKIDQELMIGEIRSVHLDVEVALARKALVIIVLSYVFAFVLRYCAGRLSNEVNVLLIVCFVSVLLLSYPIIRLIARFFAYVVTTWAPGVLYRGNGYYFLVALHHDIALVVWAILSVIIWRELFHKWVFPEESHDARTVNSIGGSLLQCHLALRVGILVKNFLVLLVATSYLWRPYLERVQSSILAQYILLLLTDYSLKGTCNPDDQKFALEMVRQGHENTKKISLYAVSKAMGFIPRNKLEHSFFRHLAGSDTLDSSSDATIVGNYLFDKLISRSRPKISPWVAAVTATAGKEHHGDLRKQGMSTKSLGQKSKQNTARPGLRKRHSDPHVHQSNPPPLSSSTSVSSEEDRVPLVGKGGGSSSSLVGGVGGGGGGGNSSGSSSGDDSDHEGGGGNYPATKKSAASKKTTRGLNALRAARERAHAPSSGSGAGGGAGGGGKGVDEMSTSEHQNRGDRASMDAQVMSIPEEDEDNAREGSVENVGGEDRGGMGQVVEEEEEAGGGASTEEEDETGPEEALVRETLCPPLDEELIDIAFSHFDEDSSGTVTREEMVIGVVRAFEDHRSLASTLQDSEHIARKLGLIIMGVITFILVFVWLSIWGLDVMSLSVTFASFLIAFSFMIGTAASNLMSSVLFIFVSRLYDVGDRVHIYDGMSGEAMKDMTVTKVDLMTTHFKRWDEMLFYMPNHLLAAKTIVNIQRSAHQWHEFFIQVAVTTPSYKLKSLNASLQTFCKKKDKPEGLYPKMGFALASIENTNKLSIRLTFRQRGNWQQMEKKWAIQSMCTWAIKNACGSLGIAYTMPEVPIDLRKQKDA